MRLLLRVCQPHSTYKQKSVAFAHVFCCVVMGLVNPHAGKDGFLGI